MRIQHNIMAMNAYRNYSNNTSALSKNLEKLSSGYKINRAGDDAAGLAISEKMRAQITGLEVAQKNAKDGISLVQTAEGALTEVHDMLNRMVELADQSANGTYDESDRDQLQKEVDELRKEINRIADTSNFNGIKLLNGDMAGGANVDGQIGNVKVSFSVSEKTAATIGTDASITLQADENSEKGIDVTFGANGAVTIKLGTKTSANSYTAEEIAQAVRDKAAAEVAAGNTSNGEAFYTSFNMDADGVLNFKAGDTATNFTTGKVSLQNGTGSGLTLQIGDTSESANRLSVSIKDCHTSSMNLDAIDISDQDGALDAIDVIKDAIDYISDVRGTLGATQNRLDHTINNLSVMQENIQDAESTIRDTDVADEMMAYTKNNILVQSAQAMLAQANQVPQGVLQLLQ